MTDDNERISELEESINGLKSWSREFEQAHNTQITKLREDAQTEINTARTDIHEAIEGLQNQLNELRKDFNSHASLIIELRNLMEEHVKEIHTRSHNQAKKIEGVLRSSFMALQLKGIFSTEYVSDLFKKLDGKKDTEITLKNDQKSLVSPNYACGKPKKDSGGELSDDLEVGVQVSRPSISSEKSTSSDSKPPEPCKHPNVFKKTDIHYVCKDCGWEDCEPREKDSPIMEQYKIKYTLEDIKEAQNQLISEFVEWIDYILASYPTVRAIPKGELLAKKKILEEKLE